MLYRNFYRYDFAFNLLRTSIDQNFNAAEKYAQFVNLIFSDIWHRHYRGRCISVVRCRRIQSFYRRKDNGSAYSSHSCGIYRFHYSFSRVLRCDQGALQHVNRRE